MTADPITNLVARFHAARGKRSVRSVAIEIGMRPTTLYGFVNGKSSRKPQLEKIEAWVEAQPRQIAPHDDIARQTQEKAVVSSNDATPAQLDRDTTAAAQAEPPVLAQGEADAVVPLSSAEQAATLVNFIRGNIGTVLVSTLFAAFSDGSIQAWLTTEAEKRRRLQ